VDVGVRWLVAVVTALALFGGCWLGLASARVLDMGSDVGVASVPLVIVLAVLGAWAERARERKTVKPGVRAGRDVNISALSGGVAAGVIHGNVAPPNPPGPGPVRG
jgi:hypothetical protein